MKKQRKRLTPFHFTWSTDYWGWVQDTEAFNNVHFEKKITILYYTYYFYNIFGDYDDLFDSSACQEELSEFG